MSPAGTRSRCPGFGCRGVVECLSCRHTATMRTGAARQPLMVHADIATGLAGCLASGSSAHHRKPAVLTTRGPCSRWDLCSAPTPAVQCCPHFLYWATMPAWNWSGVGCAYCWSMGNPAEAAAACAAACMASWAPAWGKQRWGEGVLARLSRPSATTPAPPGLAAMLPSLADLAVLDLQALGPKAFPTYRHPAGFQQQMQQRQVAPGCMRSPSWPCSIATWEGASSA